MSIIAAECIVGIPKELFSKELQESLEAKMRLVLLELLLPIASKQSVSVVISAQVISLKVSGEQDIESGAGDAKGKIMKKVDPNLH